MKKEEALEYINTRSQFYSDNYKKILLALVALMAVLVVTVLILFAVLAHRPQPKYFAVTPSGQVTPMVALSEPNLSPSAVIQWASDAVRAAYSYNFVNYRQELEAASQYFTPDGWARFVEQLKASNNITAITSKKLVVSAVVNGAPVIVWDGKLADGRYAWRIQLPLQVTYEGASGEPTQQGLVVALLVVRVEPVYSARGLAISQFIDQSSL